MTIQPVASLKEFFRDALHDALTHQHVAVDDQTEHYVVNLLTLFSDADALFERVHDMMLGKASGDDLGSLRALQGVSRFPVRVKCASLAWHALRNALHADAAQAPVAQTE